MRNCLKERMDDEDWQLSKDSADAATAGFPCLHVWERKFVRRQRERKKRNQNRNRGSLTTFFCSCIVPTDVLKCGTGEGITGELRFAGKKLRVGGRYTPFSMRKPEMTGTGGFPEINKRSDDRRKEKSYACSYSGKLR